MSTQTCAGCNTSSTTLKACGVCKHAYYCNKVCQKAHWKAHKPTFHPAPKDGELLVVLCDTGANGDLIPGSFGEAEAESLTQHGVGTKLSREYVEYRRSPEGYWKATVDEEKYQEWKKKEAAKVAAKDAEEAAALEALEEAEEAEEAAAKQAQATAQKATEEIDGNFTGEEGDPKGV